MEKPPQNQILIDRKGFDQLCLPHGGRFLQIAQQLAVLWGFRCREATNQVRNRVHG